MAFKSEWLMELMLDYFSKQSEAASGKSTKVWFTSMLGEDVETKIRETLAELDASTFEAYLASGGDSFASSADQVKRRLELLLAQAALAGFRQRYVAGEESRPRSELDTRRYSMYSSQARTIMLERFKDLLDEEEG